MNLYKDNSFANKIIRLKMPALFLVLKFSGCYEFSNSNFREDKKTQITFFLNFSFFFKFIKKNLIRDLFYV